MKLVADILREINLEPEERESLIYEIPDELVSIIEEANLQEEEISEEQILNHFPTQQEYNEQVEANEAQKHKTQKLTHGDQCIDCQKAVNTTGNPASVMRFCNITGNMVSKYSTSCNRFVKTNKSKNMWEPYAESED